MKRQELYNPKRDRGKREYWNRKEATESLDELAVTAVRDCGGML
jgi:hypothetical protein